MRLLIGMLGALALMGFLYSIGLVYAHEAPSGWTYPFTCCSNADCREISDEAIQLVPEGYKIRATNEVFLPPGTAGIVTRYAGDHGPAVARESPDGKYHRCSVNGLDESHTFCLFVPPMGS